MSLSDPSPRRAAPLTSAEEAAILEAVTAGGRTQRAVAEDPTMPGTHEQVRRVVDHAIRDDPSLLIRYPKLKKPAAALRMLDVVETEELAPEPSVFESLAAAGVPLDDLRVARVVTRRRPRIRLVRNADGSVSVLRYDEIEIRVEWVPNTADAVRPAERQHRSPVRTVAPATAVGDGCRRLRPWKAVGILLLIVVFAAAVVRLVEVPAPVLGGQTASSAAHR